MPCELWELERGAVCLALYPFTTGFPLEVVRELEDDLSAQLERFETVEEVTATIRPGDPPAEVLVQFKLRRVVLLQDGTEPRLEDVSVARVNSVTDRKRAHEQWYRRIQEGIHPTQLLIGNEESHGTAGKEAYVDLMSIAPVRKSTLLRRAGMLDEDEMRAVSERAVRALELDISDYVRQLAPPPP